MKTKQPKIKLYLPADWTLRNRASTHENEKDARNRRNSKQAKREIRNDLKWD